MPTSRSAPIHAQPGPVIQPPDFLPFKDLAQRLLPMRRVRDLYNRAQQPVNRSLLENLISEMQVEYRVADSDLARVPAEGSAVVIANHPFGILDGTILGTILNRVRPDVKIVTNSLLSGIPELHECCFFVDPFGTRQSVEANRRALRQSLAWLEQGGMLAIFPAGEVSHLHWGRMQVGDPEWSTVAARLARLSESPVLPVYFDGRNSVAFLGLGLVHPGLRTAWLLNEFLGQRGKQVEVRIGSSISPEIMESLGSDYDCTRYLRWRTYFLAERAKSRTRRSVVLHLNALKPPEPVAAAGPRDLLIAEVSRFRPEQCLAEGGDFRVYAAEAAEIPNLMQELGRLREVSFRAAGEGSGKCHDLDRFDSYYKHLLLWSKSKQELVGAYRIGHTSQILPLHGVAGLYTSSLFHYAPRLFDRMGPAIELGRSFVRPEYQKQYQPLLLLWKGIGRYVATRPENAVLFGAVSISRQYNRASRDLMFRYFQARDENSELAAWIKPRRPFRRPFPRQWIRPMSEYEPCQMFQDFEQLSDPIADVETDGKGLPVLLRHYARLGGQFLSFNVDRSFSDVLDGFVMVDLRQSDPILLARYLSKEGVRRLRTLHGLQVGEGKVN
jgi:putative hemolysin